MKERPILMSAPMVRAILNDTKTQTRRLVKTSGPQFWEHKAWTPEVNSTGILWRAGTSAHQMFMPIPYGQPNDRLWVKETFHHGDAWYPSEPGMEWKNCHRNGRCTWVDYAATYVPDRGETERPFHWKPSIFMPRLLSRITLEVTAVRMERLQGINEADAIAEGIIHDPHLDGFCYDREGRGFHGSSAVRAYENLWRSINGPGSWEANPWVWVIEFRRILP